MSQPPVIPLTLAPAGVVDGGSATVLGGRFLDRLYSESFALLVEARNYFAYRESEDVKGLAQDARLLVSQETMRITCRLTQVMAWLFCQKAVANGERPAEWALQPEFELGGTSVCLNERWLNDERLPGAICDLQTRSLRLYQRVGRLDRLQRADLPDPDAATADAAAASSEPATVRSEPAE